MSAEQEDREAVLSDELRAALKEMGQIAEDHRQREWEDAQRCGYQVAFRVPGLHGRYRIDHAECSRDAGHIGLHLYEPSDWGDDDDA